MLPRAVACFTFDNMGEAADVGSGRLSGPRTGTPDPSLERGYPAILALLDEHRVRGSFFVEGWNGEHHAEAVAELVRRGHELGMHGWLHESWHELPPDEEEALAERATAALERAAGVRPVGFRAPGGARSSSTEAILARLDYAYDASLGDGMRPRLLPSGLAQVPFVWPCVDGLHYLRDHPVRPAEVCAGWLRALEGTAERGGLFLTICHAFLTGVDPERLAALDRVIAAAVADSRLTIMTTGEVARELRA
jgi:peptidoglycan/xylan/chitin deacetylase (PgdA/CDA1 family)